MAAYNVLIHNITVLISTEMMHHTLLAYETGA
jgi:hypothetical protein